jgi:hypothetical protein
LLQKKVKQFFPLKERPEIRNYDVAYELTFSLVNYHIVASTSLSCFEAHAGIFGLLKQGIFDAYAFDKILFFELVTRINTRDFTVVVHE